ncbi:MAG: M20/M25/M40 family metallo-hydrolase [Actinobacteria bacterium]|jgi:acetylornithine deacetylase/succinyl-diaminopimelate desuccinylase-like protein|nr:M20/M25/M40 family metallo-hydrolase [Actinomycetota bacterium]NBP11765.1 M20/M25/M40 family metallo-hydrolase [Actinomycetota bacterium]NBP42563.1 M20/M25/M40 family metallo-hydrolase [Actinomycetota bacterium]NBQ01170.1 M20/M25/M40 family metallo-hydrolase [Actinomycetota bacterium]NBQ66228.1 M20/M25/M40 family metallo-hydrolase [Actinomycetota bacterium]
MKLTDAQRIELEEDVVKLCQELIQIPSVNFGEGKGDEKAAAEYVAAKMKEVGIESKIYESAPNRCSVVARIEGKDKSRPGLVVNGHLDVVPANAADWSVDPFSGAIKDGCIWGRGAVDMKNMDAMILAVIRLWARHNYQPERSIVIVFFGDEEAGGIYGSRWMAEKHPEVFAGCSETISEVGGFSLTLLSGKRVYAIEASQKGIEWMKITAEGVAGHGSMVNNANAVTRLTEAIAKIGNYTWPQRITKTSDLFFQKISELSGKPYDRNNLQPLIDEVGPMGKMIGATLCNTTNPTMLEAGYKANVIPQSASAVVDGRTLPGYEKELLDTVKSLVGEHVKVESLVSDIPLEVEFGGPLVDAMIAAIKSEDPDGIPIPYLLSGGTDNKALAKLGIVGYGFSPLKLPPDLDFTGLFHGIDERVPIDSLQFGARTLFHFLVNA